MGAPGASDAWNHRCGRGFAGTLPLRLRCDWCCHLWRPLGHLARWAPLARLRASGLPGPQALCARRGAWLVSQRYPCTPV